MEAHRENFSDFCWSFTMNRCQIPSCVRPDTIPLTLGLAGGINPYVYANNDPVNGSDPSGMDQCITIDIPPSKVCSGNYCTELEGYTKEVCISGGGSGSSGSGSSGDGIGSTGGATSAPPTPQQVFTAVGKELTPFNNAKNHGMDCAERSGELAVSSTGDWSLLKALKKVFSIQTITELVTRTLSIGETKVTMSTVSTGRAIVVNSAAAKQAGRIYAVGAAQTRGFNWIHGDNPLLSYVPVVGEALYGIPAAARACTAGASE